MEITEPLKLLVASCSLQGGLEEPIADRIANYFYSLVLQKFPQHHSALFTRGTKGYVGDAYRQLRIDVNAYKPLVHMCFHVNSYRATDKGYMHLYCRDKDLALYLEKAMLFLVVRGYTYDLGISQRCDVGVLDSDLVPPEIHVDMPEVGFYSNPEELSLLQTQWYCAEIAYAEFLGFQEYLRVVHGIVPKDEEVQEMDLKWVTQKEDIVNRQKMDVDIYEAAIRNTSRLMIDTNEDVHDMPCVVYLKPEKGEFLNKGRNDDFRMAGNANSENVHGLSQTIEQLFGESGQNVLAACENRGFIEVQVEAEKSFYGTVIY